MVIKGISTQTESSSHRLNEFIKKNKCRIGSWLFSICSAWFGVAEYGWLKQKIWCIDLKFVCIIIPVIFAGILQAIHLYFEHLEKIRIKDLEEKLNGFNAIKKAIPEIINNSVIAIYENISLSIDDRITLYLLCEDAFLPCARYSGNPSILPIKRTKYNKNKGVIQKVWETGWHFDGKFPNPTNVKEYQKHHIKKYGLNRAEVKALSMRPTLYCGIRISDTTGREPIAVLIIESMKKNNIEEQIIREKLEKEIDKLVPLLENEIIRSCIPNQSIIEVEEGF